MTIDEAIWLISKHLGTTLPEETPPIEQAYSLAIEALKRVAAIRLIDKVEARTVLPGETKEKL